MELAPATLYATAPLPVAVSVGEALPGRTADEVARGALRTHSWGNGQRLAGWLYLHVAADVVDQLVATLAYLRDHPDRAHALAANHGLPLPPPPPLT